MQDKKYFYVTGGSRGIGEAIGGLLSEDDNNLVFYSYKTKPSQLLGKKRNVIPIHADCSVSSDIKNIYEVIIKEAPYLDGIVNNLGVARFELLNNTSNETWDNIFSTNLKSVWLHYKIGLNFLKKKPSSIINVSSLVSEFPKKGTGAYAASKLALNALSKVMFFEAQEYDIRVNWVLPGFVLTDALQDTKYDSIRMMNLSEIPLKCFGTPENIAHTVKFLLEYKGINGSGVFVTGGQHI